MTALSGAELERYQRDGYLVRDSVFDATELESLRDGVEAAIRRGVTEARAGDEYILDGKRFVDHNCVTLQFEGRSDTMRVIEPVHQYHERIDALLDDPRIAEPMRQIIGTRDIAVWTNKLNVKRPREGSGFGWHQDSPYWMHDSAHVDLLPNVMVTLDDADENNGCFAVIRGSHANGMLPGTDDGSQLGGFYTRDDLVDESERVAFEVSAGSLIFFNPHIIHGSEPNRSDRQRRALVLTYQPGGYPMLKNGQLREIKPTAA